ncbi:pentatricopeptide repeat-containing protein At4g25270, chloroplastic-like [Vigna umbellata]|uniref:pentatricopeptide repeat-containing protein At4g25270, chloroplastic-like n=1 Tax=Vigna umbellata TaxID=87088 RepID=UPI001F5F2E3A|nr:pentatricopeptide repeat-containing protein At4g25270, chloroplastic-like [Vigna umbellata]
MISILVRFPPNATSLCAQKKNKNKNKTWKERRLEGQERRNVLRYPKPKSTPLLIHCRPPPQTHLEALEQVITNLEDSIEKGIKIDPEIYASLLEICYSLQAIHLGIRLHCLIPTFMLRRNFGISSKLLRLYAACGYMDDAHELFDQMSNRDTSAFPWNSLISGYAQMGLYDDAIALYFQMVEEGVKPDFFTFPRVLKVCARIGSLRLGEEVHRHLVRAGFSIDGFVLNALVDMYSKCGDIVKAQKIFDKMPHRDTISWNSMLIAYVHHDLEIGAMNIFYQMILEGCEPDSVSISTILTCVSSLCLGL